MPHPLRPIAQPSLRARVLSVPVDAWHIDNLITTALTWSAAQQSRTIMYANVHVLNTAHSDPDLRRALEKADTVYCDGSGVRLGARVLGYRLPKRMTGADWIDEFCASAAKDGISLFLLAGKSGVAARAAEILAERHTGLRIVGTHHGYLDTQGDSDSAISAIRAARPQLVFVGMGTPLQETWVDRNRKALGPGVVWCVGALFDYVSGVQTRGPSWLVQNNMEWLARLASDPQRLWKRYLVGNPLFLARIARERLGTH